MSHWVRVFSACSVLTVKPILQTKTFTRNLPFPSSGQIDHDDGCTTSEMLVSITQITEVTDHTTEIHITPEGSYNKTN